VGPDELRRQALLEDRHFWYAARRRQVLRVLPSPQQVGARALDLGAGSGGNTGMLVDAGYAAVALEHHPIAAGLAKERGRTVVRGDGHRLPFPDETFELVLACDVLEHLADDTVAAREVRRVLTPGGHLVATVPADPTLWSAHDVALQHHRRYTRAGLEELILGAGFALESLDSWMVLLRPVVALRRRASRPTASHGAEPSEPVSDLEEVAPALNRVLALLLRLEHRLPPLRRRARGVSLIAVATKPAD
jgi:SAM-dependent methyltransferase